MNLRNGSDVDPETLFCLGGSVGLGTDGSVYKAIDVNTGAAVAIKIFDIEYHLELDEENTQNIQSQITTNIFRIKSDNIVKYKSSHIKDNLLWIVMDYCSVGSVYDIIQVTNKTLTEEQIQIILREILFGLKHLHSQNIIHRGIKASNILIDHTMSTASNVNVQLLLLTSGYVRKYTKQFEMWHKIPKELISLLAWFCRISYKGMVKLADFVVPQIIHNNLQSRSIMYIGSPLWLSPETIKSDKYDTKSDIWSVGITAIELATGNAPLHDMNPLKARITMSHSDYTSPKLPDDTIWSDEFRHFVTSCLQNDPSKRLTANELLNHEFILKAKSNCYLYDWVGNVLPKMDNWRENKSKITKIEHDMNDENIHIESSSYSIANNDSDEYDTDCDIYGTMIMSQW
eukprot:419025_1